MLNELSKYDQELYLRQRELLKYYFTEHETGSDKFIVMNNEAGFSKSRLADETIINNPKRNYLLVKKYNSEKFESLECMKKTEDIFWGGEIPREYVLVINADNSSNYESDAMADLIKAKIVIISHEKYKLLSYSNKLGLYTNNRHTLIIDEYLDVPIISVNEDYFKHRRVLFPHHLGWKEFLDLENYFCYIIKNYKEFTIASGSMRLLDLSKTHKSEVASMLSRLETIEQYFQSNMANILALAEESSIKKKPITYLTYIQFFTEIRSLLENQCIYISYEKSLSTVRKFKFWTLQNNIILDASGDILSEYRLNERFEIKQQKRVFDYSDTTIHFKEANSLKYTIEKRLTDEEPRRGIDLYFDAVKEFIINNHNNDSDKSLIVNYKVHNDTYFNSFDERAGVSLAWHGNIMGKNDWRECNKIFVNSTFNLPEAAYALIYSFYSGKKLAEEDLEIITDKSRIFKKHEIESLKQNFILHNLYQTVKRINRDVDKKSDIYVICDNQHFIKNIKSLLKNAIVKFDYGIDLPAILPTNHKIKQRDKYVIIEKELKRMVSNVNDKSQLLKKLFCKNIRLESNRLKDELYIGYIKELCDKYGLDYVATFQKNSRHFYFNLSQ